MSSNLKGGIGELEVGSPLTREDVRGEVRSALELFAVEALQKEMQKLEDRMQNILQKSAEATIQNEAQELRVSLRQELRSALDEWWASAPRFCTGNGASTESASRVGTAPKAKMPTPLQGLWSSTSGSSWPPQNVNFPARSRASTLDSPSSFSPSSSLGIEDMNSKVKISPPISQSLTNSPSAKPKSPPMAQASPSSMSTPGSPVSTPSGFPVKDWRKNFVEKATKANRKIEYLHGTQCRESHQVNDVLEAAAKALEDGVRPTLVEDGVGGTYFIKDSDGQSIAVFKPRDEEAFGPNNPKDRTGEGQGAGLKEGVLVGEAAINEYVAFLLDQMNSTVLRAGVCPTALVCVAHSVFHSAEESRKSVFRSIKDKVGSFQLFAKHQCTSEDMGSQRFPAERVHAIAVLDIRLCNTDRHAGNMLVRDDSPFSFSDNNRSVDLVPIDHGYCLPAAGLAAVFDWMSWPAAKQPFSDAMRTKILAIDIDATAEKLRRRVPCLRTECIYTLNTCTMLLKHGVEIGLTAYDIGLFMTRPESPADEAEHERHSFRPSALEELVAEARQQASERHEPERHRTILDGLMKSRCRDALAEKNGWIKQVIA